MSSNVYNVDISCLIYQWGEFIKYDKETHQYIVEIYILLLKHISTYTTYITSISVMITSYVTRQLTK